MTARIITQYSYDAYCPDCGWVLEGFEEEDWAQEAVDAHNQGHHR